MKSLKTIVLLAVLAALGGCAVVPAPGYYRPGPAYYGGWHGGYWR
jgi:hypothetical protein